MGSCLAQEAHGYSPGDISSFKLTEIMAEEFDEGMQDTDHRIIKRPTGGRYANEEAQFHGRESQIDHWGQEVSSSASDGPVEYFFSLESIPGPLTALDVVPQLPEPCLLQVVDVAGELSTWSRPLSEDWSEQLDELEKQLRITNAAIVVVPLDSHDSDPWAAH